MPKFLLLILLPFLCAQTSAPDSSPKPTIQVTCVGASITAGFGTTDHLHDSYPAQLQSLLGPTYLVHNFGVSGRTMLKKGDRPYWDTKQYQQAIKSNPNIVIIDLGGNDTKPENWVHKADFSDDTGAMIKSFQVLPSHPHILLLLAFPFRPHGVQTNDEIITKEQMPVMKKIAEEMKVETVDMHTPFADKPHWFADGIHPNKEGHALAAKILHDAIATPATQPAK